MKKSLTTFLLIVFVFCTLQVVCYGQGEVYRIGDNKDFLQFANMVNYGENFRGDAIYLETDINTKEIYKKFTPIGNMYRHFSGTFYGGGHTITMHIDEPEMQCVGLFRWLREANIYDLNLHGVVKGESNVGSLAGVFEKSLASDCNSYVLVEGLFGVGGFVGALDSGLFLRCSSNGEVFGQGTTDKFCGAYVEASFMS